MCVGGRAEFPFSNVEGVDGGISAAWWIREGISKVWGMVRWNFLGQEWGWVEFPNFVCVVRGMGAEIPILPLTVPYLHPYDKGPETVKTGELYSLPMLEIA